MTVTPLEARPDPRPLPTTLQQGIWNLENAIFSAYFNSPERDDAFESLRELTVLLGRMTTRAELAEAEARARTRAQVEAEENL